MVTAYCDCVCARQARSHAGHYLVTRWGGAAFPPPFYEVQPRNPTVRKARLLALPRDPPALSLLTKVLLHSSYGWGQEEPVTPAHLSSALRPGLDRSLIVCSNTRWDGLVNSKRVFAEIKFRDRHTAQAFNASPPEPGT